MFFLELLVLFEVVVEGSTLWLVGVVFQNLNNALDLWQVQLLVKSVESRSSLSPKLGLVLSRRQVFLLLFHILRIERLFNRAGP